MKYDLNTKKECLKKIDELEKENQELKDFSNAILEIAKMFIPVCPAKSKKMFEIAIEKGRKIACNVHEKRMELLSLVDGAYEIVYLYDAKSPDQKKWKEKWLKKAKELGARFDC